MSPSLTVESVYGQLGLADSPAIVDVRSGSDYLSRPRLIPGALRGNPEQIGQWARMLARHRPVCVYCSHGDSVSHSVADALIALGYPTFVLDGGLDAWMSGGYATIKVRADVQSPGGSRWVTRERPKIDRVACPWLVKRFIDPSALFFYTPAHRVRSEAEALGAQPYDIADVTFSHRGRRCSFDAFLDEFDLHDPVLDAIADIVRAADTGELADSPQAPGLLAISLGLSASVSDDLLLLERAMPIYDSLYAWRKVSGEETHSWPKQSN